MGFGGPLDFDLPTARSQVSGGGSGPGGFADDTELANAAYGQAKTQVTPLQMALVASTVANGGVLMRPHLVTATTVGTAPARSARPSSPASSAPTRAAAINHAMVGAVESDIGQQFTTGAKVPGVVTAGKSGTAELGGTGEPHSWFIGFAPADHPTVAIAVIVERGGRGGSAGRAPRRRPDEPVLQAVRMNDEPVGSPADRGTRRSTPRRTPGPAERAALQPEDPGPRPLARADRAWPGSRSS